MRGPKPDPLSLGEAERTELKRLVRRQSTGQQLALRGRIILEANAGKNNSQIARELGTSLETVRTWRKRWLAFPFGVPAFGLFRKGGVNDDCMHARAATGAAWAPALGACTHVAA